MTSNLGDHFVQFFETETNSIFFFIHVGAMLQYRKKTTLVLIVCVVNKQGYLTSNFN